MFVILEKLGLLNWSMKFDKNFKSELDAYLTDFTPDRKSFKRCL